jgi:ppGpp synthetase/RelA/SpoT-type nucleotidyltranferase
MTHEENFERYTAIRGQYEMAAKHVKDIISLQTATFKIQDVQFRAKSADSFVEKAKKCDVDGVQKYTDPFRQITDLAGVRLICFLKRDVDPICDMILNVFKSENVEDVGDRVFQKGRFGYQSKHILVNLPKSTYLPHCDYIDEVICEIQVRTLLQHAWAEMEHDIQYKGESVPDLLRKRFVALAGLLEIADGEFERIQKDSDALKSVVEDELISRLTAEGFTEKSSKTRSETGTSSILGVRDLVSSGHYEDALEIYNEKIDSEPASHTLLIGRSKVKFLLGDSQGALFDLDRAKSINSNDPAVHSLRKLIEGGNIDLVNTSSSKAVDPGKIGQVFELMLKGEGKKAFDLISEIEEEGYNKAFAFLNKAACCLLELDTRGAREYLGKLQTNIGTPMSVNIHILKYFLSVVENRDEKEAKNELKLVVSAVPQFKWELSPLLNFISGFKLRNRHIFNSVQKNLMSIDRISIPA